MAIFIVAWICLGIVVGIIAQQKGFKFARYFFLSLFLSPLIAVIILLASKPPAKKSKGKLKMLRDSKTYELAIVGESHYQDALSDICDGRNEEGHRLETDAILVLEDDNPHDKNAIRVDIEGNTVGYLSRDVARSFRKRIAREGVTDKEFSADALILGGWDRGEDDTGSFGVKLDMDLAPEAMVIIKADARQENAVNASAPEPTAVKEIPCPSCGKPKVSGTMCQACGSWSG